MIFFSVVKIGFLNIYQKISGKEASYNLMGFLNNFFYIAMGYGVTGVFIFVFEILAGRVLGPAEYGKYVLVNSLGLFFYFLMTLGLNNAVVYYLAKVNDFKSRQKIISLAYLLFFTSTIFIGFGGIIFSQYFLNETFNISTNIFQLAIFFAFSYSFYIFNTFLLTINKLTFESAIYSLCFSNLIVPLVFIVIFLRNFFDFSIDFSLVQKMFKYGFNVMIGVAFFTFLPVFSKLMVNSFLSVEEVGVYNAYYFSSINIMVFLYNIFITVFFPTISMRENKKSILIKIRKILPFIIIGGFIFLLAIQFLIFQFYGSQYQYNNYLAFFFSLAAILMVIYCIYGWIFYSAGMSGANFVTGLSAVIFFINVFIRIYLIPFLNLSGAIFSIIIAYSIGLIFLFMKKDLLTENNHRNIKVCHIVSADITVKFLLMPQLSFLITEGYDVFVVCSGGKWVKDIERESIKVKTIKLKRKISPFSDLVALWQLFWFFKKEKFDIVHTHTPKPALLGQMAAKMAGVPIIINTVHGLYFGNKFSFLKKQFYIFIERLSDGFSDLIFSQNKEDINTMRERKIGDQNKIKYLGNGIDLEVFDNKRFSAEFLNKKKEKLGLSESCKIVGAVGRLVAEKGYLELFSAFKKVLEKHPDIILLVVGPEEFEKKDAFKQGVVEQFGISKNVIFLGERSDIYEIYPLMNIFVLASHREGFPRSVIEASAMEKSVIATDIRGCREAVDNGKTGILVPVANPEKLAESIIYLLQNPKEAERLGKNGRLKVEKEFDEKLVFDRIKIEYDRLIKEKIYKNKDL